MDDDLRKARLKSMGVFTQFEPFLETLDGMTAAVERRGFTTEQAHAIVAYVLGYRPVDGSKPEGVGE